MGYRFKKFFVENEIKLFLFLMRNFNISQGQAQRMIDKKRVYQNKKPLTDKKATVYGEVDILVFEPITKGLKPIFETKDFAIFDKPSGLIVHPRNKKRSYSVLDEARAYLGKDANIIHRIDLETSGLIIVSKHKECEKYLKKCFENRSIKKEYIALAKGEIKRDILIDEPIKKNSDFTNIRLKVLIDKSGKHAQTLVMPLKYYQKIDSTLVKIIPYTGRQHQIRIHLFHVKHPIVGDPIYGVSTESAIRYLDGVMDCNERIKVSGHSRLMLHANYLEFEYKSIKYKIFSKMDFNKEIKKVISRGSIF